METTDSDSTSFLDIEVLRRLLRQLERTDIDELEMVDGSSRLYLRRDPGPRSVAPASERSDERTVPDGVAISAPLTGVFYLRSGPGQAPYVSVGEQVEVGQIVALIETMKLYNEVVADVAGEVLQISPGDGDLVEAGQALVYVRPREEGEQV